VAEHASAVSKPKEKSAAPGAARSGAQPVHPKGVTPVPRRRRVANGGIAGIGGQDPAGSRSMGGHHPPLLTAAKRTGPDRSAWPALLQVSIRAASGRCGRACPGVFRGF